MVSEQPIAMEDGDGTPKEGDGTPKQDEARRMA